MIKYKNKILKCAAVVGVCGIVLSSISAGFSDGDKVGNGVIYGMILAALCCYLIFFIAVVIADISEKAEVVKIPDEEDPLQPEKFTAPERKEKFRFTNDTYDFLRGHGEVSEE